MNAVLSRLLLTCFLALATLYPAYAADWTIDQLMQSLAKNSSGRATFKEKKFISYLDRPVESSGELRFVAPDRLEKRTQKPQAENMIVDGDTLTLERGGQKHTVQMQEYPELAGFIDSIRGTLAGDRKALERLFKLQLDGTSEAWNLTLWPIDAKLKTNVHLVKISGNRDNVRAIEIIQTDGDRSVMNITRTETK